MSNKDDDTRPPMPATVIPDLQEIERQVRAAKHMPLAYRVRLMNRLFAEFLHQYGHLPKEYSHLKPKEH